MRFHQTFSEPVPCPVKCDYCTTVDTAGRQNCLSCGGPLPRPEVQEMIVERRIVVSRDMLDCTMMGDDRSTYVEGIFSGEAFETKRVVERKK